MSLLTDFVASFLLGLATPLGAVCVLPLYPGFLAYLSNQFSNGEKPTRKQYALFGLIITSGVILFMLLLGLLFTTLLQASLTNVIGVVSPIAFGVMALISLLLIFDIDLSKYIPKANVPVGKSSVRNALLYGFFFGAIVIPCNPAFIGAFFARSFIATSFVSSMVNFFAFGIGLGFPLLAFSLLSAQWNQSIIRFLTKNKRSINLVAGLLMLGISVYYLVFVFRVFS